MKKTVAALGVALMTLSACGGGGGDDATATENLKAEILANSTVGGAASVTDKQAGCIADGTVEKIGVTQLKKYKILTEDLKVNQGIENVTMTKDDAEALAGVFVDCIDTEKLFEDQFTSGAGTAAKLTAKQRRCVTDAVTEDVIRKVLAESFQGQQNEAYTALQEEVMKCAIGEAATP